MASKSDLENRVRELEVQLDSVTKLKDEFERKLKENPDQTIQRLRSEVGEARSKFQVTEQQLAIEKKDRESAVHRDVYDQAMKDKESIASDLQKIQFEASRKVQERDSKIRELNTMVKALSEERTSLEGKLQEFSNTSIEVLPTNVILLSGQKYEVVRRDTVKGLDEDFRKKHVEENAVVLVIKKI